MKALWRKKTLIKRWLPLDDAQWGKLNLLKTLVQRDLEARYKGSILGKLWPLLNQVSQLLIYTYVFGVVLQLRLSLIGLPEDNSFIFGLWLFAGLLPWLAFSGGLSQATTSVITQSNLVKKVVFPLSLLPLVPILSTFIESTFGLMALITFVVLATQKLHPTLLLLPLVWFPQLCLTAGLGFLTAGLSVFLRDIPQTLGVILNLWFYATPLIYPANMIPQPFQSWVFWLNPMAAIGELYRDMILTGTVTHWNEWAVATIASIMILLGSFWCYRKLRPAFADVL
ncbi:ABC transporter permease [filamentous cyanobacterium CCT1]|nr:ABC transporter permease [filamentous cyanobacterium CCT1]PSN80608.1 ABC transporter permease [filamentous cyanobacterium CCP4]